MKEAATSEQSQEEPRSWGLVGQARAMCPSRWPRVAHAPTVPGACPAGGCGAVSRGSGAASQPRSASALQINDETELEALCAEIASQHLATESPDGPNKPCCRFTYLTMTGEEVELCSRGRHVPVA